jgi:hypothetical protein
MGKAEVAKLDALLKGGAWTGNANKREKAAKRLVKAGVSAAHGL